MILMSTYSYVVREEDQIHGECDRDWYVRETFQESKL